MENKILGIIIVVVVGVAAGLGVYVYTSQQQIQMQYDISNKEQCAAKVQSFQQRAQDALNSGSYTYEQWRSLFDPEVKQLNIDCPDQMKPVQ